MIPYPKFKSSTGNVLTHHNAFTLQARQTRNHEPTSHERLERHPFDKLFGNTMLLGLYMVSIWPDVISAGESVCEGVRWSVVEGVEGHITPRRSKDSLTHWHLHICCLHLLIGHICRSEGPATPVEDKLYLAFRRPKWLRLNMIRPQDLSGPGTDMYPDTLGSPGGDEGNWEDGLQMIQNGFQPFE